MLGGVGEPVMSGGLIAERAKLSWFVARRALSTGVARLNAHPLLRWRFFRPDRPPPDRAAGPAHRRPDPRERDLCGPLRLRGQDRDLRRPLAVRDRAAVGRMGGAAARLRLAAPSARRRIGHHARERARAGRMDLAAGPVAAPIAWRPDMVARRIISWLSQAPLVLHDADPRFYRRFLAQPDPAGAICAAPRTRATAVPRSSAMMALTYAALCMAGQERLLRVDHAPAGRRAAAPGAARRRSRRAATRRADRAPARSPAAAPGVLARNVVPPPR